MRLQREMDSMPVAIEKVAWKYCVELETRRCFPASNSFKAHYVEKLIQNCLERFRQEQNLYYAEYNGLVHRPGLVDFDHVLCA